MPAIPKCPSCGARPSASADVCPLCGALMRQPPARFPFQFSPSRDQIKIFVSALLSMVCLGPIAAIPGLIWANRETRRMEETGEDMQLHPLIVASRWVFLFVLIFYGLALVVVIGSKAGRYF